MSGRQPAPAADESFPTWKAADIQDANCERLGDEAIDAVQIMLDRREAARAA